MRSIRRPETINTESDAAARLPDTSTDHGGQAQSGCCDSAGSRVSLWLGDFMLALGCFAAVTAAGQLPLTAPRLLEAISSARIAAAAKRSTTQRETKIENAETKPHDGKAVDSKPHLPTIATLN